jgi:TolB-like protein
MVIGVAVTACATTSDHVGATHASPLQTPEQNILTVAVLEFEDHGIGQTVATQGLGRTLADRISEQLSGRPDLRLIDRESLQKILEELSLASLDIADRESQLRLGKLLGAQYLIMGGYTSLAGGLRIDGRIVEVEKGVVEGSSLEGRIAERAILEKSFSKQMADQLIAKVGLSMGAPKTGQDYFLQGLTLEQSNNNQKALEMYQKALAIDPQHHEARERMENLLLKELQ